MNNSDMALNYIQMWGSNSGAMGRVELTFIAITPRSTLTRNLEIYVWELCYLVEGRLVFIAYQPLWII